MIDHSNKKTHEAVDSSSECGASSRETNSLRALHLPGGNFYDDMRIDINASHDRIDNYICLLQRQNRPARRSLLAGKMKYLVTAILQKAGLLEAFCLLGVRRRWLDEFLGYWTSCLAGRPLRGIDFYLLYHEYRKKQQRPAPLDWGSTQQHIRNWQDPAHLFSVFSYARFQAVSPIVPMHIWRHLPDRGRYLEYGCSLAPFYSNSREFGLKPNAQWTIADIPSFAFHYAKYRYCVDENLDFATIRDLKNPLTGSEVYDVVFLTTVLEHVDDPVAVVQYLFARMRPGSVFVFDYIESDGTGLDTPSALSGRRECLNLIADRTKILDGGYVETAHQPLTVVQLVR